MPKYDSLPLKAYLTSIASQLDALTGYIADPGGALARAGLSKGDQEILLSGNQQHIYERVSGASPDTAPATAETSLAPAINDERLVAVGSGIRTVGHFTMEALAWIRVADKVLHVVADPVAEELIQTLNPKGAESLSYLYAENKLRAETYRQMIEVMLGYVRQGKRVCFVAYGHPGVFVYPTHEAIRRARAEGYKARMLPGISAEACLLADLGIDMLAGAQSFEATDFLANHRRLDPCSHVMLWQIGGLGDATFKRHQFEVRGMPQLVRKLMQWYQPSHISYLYEAPLYPGVEPSIRPGPLGHLAYTYVSPSSTLYIPPVGTPQPDLAVRHELNFS